MVYVVVTAGPAFGLCALESDSEAAGVHTNVPEPDVEIAAESPTQIVSSALAVITRLGDTVITMVSLFTQPFVSVPVTTYVVVEAGVATGL
jgi:hypothetical protein